MRTGFGQNGTAPKVPLHAEVASGRFFQHGVAIPSCEKNQGPLSIRRDFRDERLDENISIADLPGELGLIALGTGSRRSPRPPRARRNGWLDDDFIPLITVQ